MKKFKLGAKVQVAECYLTDEVTANVETSQIATVNSEPKDSEELVAIIYESGVLDYVPQDILEVVEPIGTCNRTGEYVYPSIVEGYTAYCPELDEDLYDIEWTPIK